jgi:adenine-specific DNA-methyltransferase
MEKLDLQTPNFTDENIQKLSELFPNCVTEDADGKAIDFDQLRQELSNNIIEGNQERYQLTWPGKAKSIVTANTPINKTLRPNREESKDFDNTENLYIEGDNLEVLKLLQETYLGKIKVVYVDPPYNTGNDILYKNDFFDSQEDYLELSEQVSSEGFISTTNTETNGRFHSDWLSMMFPRVKLSRSLLADNGMLILAIDHNELNTLTSICDEIFGNSNRLGIVSVVHKPEGRNQAKYFGPSNEFMLFYAKNIDFCKFNDTVLDDELLKSFDKSDDAGVYKLKNFIRMSDGKYSLRINKPDFFYSVYLNPQNLKISTKSSEDFNIEILPITAAGQERTWKTTEKTLIERFDCGNIVPVQRDSGEWELYEKLRANQVIKTHWIDKKYHAYHYGTKVVDGLMEAKTFDFPKSLRLIFDTLKLTTKENDLVLDVFSGSATTAHAVMQLNAEDGGNRKFIMAQIPEATDEKSEAYKAGYKNIAEIGKERIRRAGEKIKEDNVDKEGINDLDVGFRVLKVGSSNMKDTYYNPDNTQQSNLLDLASNIKDSRTEEDLLFQVLLDWGVDLTLKIERKDIAGKSVYFVDDDTLAACFEENINEDFVKELAKTQPLRVVFKDGSFASDDVKINIEQIFKHTSVHTDIKVI